MRPTIFGLTHDHIDGSAAVLDILPELCELAGKDVVTRTPDELKAYFADVHGDLVKKFGAVTSMLQSREALELMGYAYGRRRAREGHDYVEAKFAPQYHVLGGLTPRQAVHAMLTGLKKAESEFAIDIFPHLCIGREATPEQGKAIARIALTYAGEVALGMACDEANHPPEKHLPAFALTFGTSTPRECHAGEWVLEKPSVSYNERLLKNIWTAVKTLRCDGIGHAIPLAEDPELIQYIVDGEIRVSGCPLSNKVTGLIDDIRVLRIDELLNAGVMYTLNPDDDLFLPSMEKVVTACEDAYEFTEKQCTQLQENVYRGAFHPDVARG